MRFKWEHYNNTHEALVDSWLDDIAVNFTGLDDGWKDFYDYWMREAKKSNNCKDYCFIVSENNEPFCIIYAGTQDTKMTISECVVAPSMRGKGYGSASIKELLDNCAMLVGEHIGVAKAVIYPNNTASQKAFEKAGFSFVSAHPNGDAWYYECPIHNNNVITHYDHLIDENNDPVHDPKPLQDYMDKWDGDPFIEKLRLDNNKKVLEIGVGTGRLAVKIAPLCKEFYGIDISPKTTGRAKENLLAFENVNLICGDYLEYNFKDTFDTVYSSLTFMHIEDKPKAICKVFDLLSDGGIFVLSIDKNQDEFIDTGTSKIRIFPDTPESIACCLNKSGFHLSEQFETEFAHIFVAKKYCKCYCGHDCSKCVTYIATKRDNNTLREQARSFYKNVFSQDIPLESFNCFGGRTENLFVLCDSCPFKKCCKEKNIVACDQCSDYPCSMLAEYQKKYVNKCNQISEK